MTDVRMNKTATAVLAAGAIVSSFAGTPEQEFANPPHAAKPQTWWHWMNGNVTREGVTADLEAMAEIGLGGAHIFDAGCAIPAGPLAFDTPDWYAMLKHACAEAKRLGLELTLSNCSGWSSSGGPWIQPPDGMKYVHVLTTNIVGGTTLELTLPKAAANDHGFYEDIAVIAFPTPEDDTKIPDWKDKTFQRRVAMEVARPFFKDRLEPGPGGTVRRDAIVDLGPMSSRAERPSAADASALRVTWDAPAGAWTVLRIGYACNGQRNHPASDNGGGLECDKLAAGPVERHFDAYAGRLLDELGVAPGKNDSAFKGLLVDSYETDCQNWTQGFDEEFRRRKGYAIAPFLPAIAGYVVDELDATESFLRDYRRVIADLFAENYGGTLARKCAEYRLDLYLEAYGNGPFEFLQYGSRATIPMGEFWAESFDDYPDTGRTAWGWWCVNGMGAPIAHVHGRKIVAAESFSAAPWNGKWRKDPFAWKATGDKAFCDGVTRIVYHRFAHQPWTNVWPGMTMGQFGSHFERTLTWWKQGSEWIAYQSRCQALLQRGDYVADVLFYRGEEPIDDGMFFTNPLGMGWKHDTLCMEDLLKLVVEDGRVGLPGGTFYPLLSLPPEGFQSERARTKIAELRKAGATIHDPAADGGTALDALSRMGRQPDFVCPPEAENQLSWIHRRLEDGADLYFVAYGRTGPKTFDCSFRVKGKVAEFWHPDTGAIYRARDVREENGRTVVSIPFEPCGSVFVVFRSQSDAPFEPVFTSESETDVKGPWTVAFTQRVTNGEPETRIVTMSELADWTSSADPFIQYFSGSATYDATIEVPALVNPSDHRVFLDLGAVKNIAEVTVNGRTFPALWKPPFRLDITDALPPSDPRLLHLRIRITNLWVNRLIGDEQLPADCEYRPRENPDGEWPGQAVKEVPAWVAEGRRSPTGRYTFATWRHFRPEDKPLPSGLLGPVKVVVCAKGQ